IRSFAIYATSKLHISPFQSKKQLAGCVSKQDLEHIRRCEGLTKLTSPDPEKQVQTPHPIQVENLNPSSRSRPKSPDSKTLHTFYGGRGVLIPPRRNLLETQLLYLVVVVLPVKNV